MVKEKLSDARANADTIETACIEGLDEVCQRALKGEYSNAEWTAAVKKFLTSYGRRQGYGVHASKDNEADTEWLYDVTWYECSKSEFLLSIPLIAEIEWNTSEGEIFYDFEKLLQSTADHKLMVFEKGRTNCEYFFDQLEHAVRMFKKRLKEDRYLFACYVNESEGKMGHFNYRLVVSK